MSMPSRPSFDGLALRFSILLAVALVAANLVAAGLLYADRARQSSASLIERELERIVSLVPAIEAAPSPRRSDAAREASTHFSRVSVDPSPIVEEVPRAPRSAALTRQLSGALSGREVRAAIMVRQGRDGPRGGETVAMSILLEGASSEAQWLNSISRGNRRGPPGISEETLLLALGVSLVSVLGVALVFVRRLTRPLNELALAARLAGHGDRTARVSETGPREVRDAAAAFNEMQARIERFDAERMRTLAAVGHDLRTPITSLRIRAEMLAEEEAAPMVRTLDEMTVMADGLVAFARGAGDAEAPLAVDLQPMLARLCADRGAEFHPAAEARISGRPVALGRAFGNLIDNALRYAGTARVSLATEGRDALVAVEDDGPGLPEAQLAEVFEPFVRGDDSRSPETGGAGLGLTIARTILASHGGSIALENREGGGLRARVRLPLLGEA
ncbi:MAG: ATP-binding protein [Pseudomonadota bacterium]